MGICGICQNDSFHDGYCDNCGRVRGQFGVVFLHSLSRPNMIVTDKYLVFVNGGSVSGMLASTMMGGAVGAGLYQASVKKKAAKAFGMIDLGTLEKATAFMPASKLIGPAVYFKFRNGTDLYLGVFEPASNRKNTNDLIALLNSLNIPTEIKDCKKLDEVKAANPIADKKTLTSTVSASAAKFLAPFKGMRVLEDQ